MAIFTCDICGMKSNYKSSVARHKKLVHGNDRLETISPEKNQRIQKANRINYSQEDRLVSMPKPSKQNDGLAEFLLEQRQEEIDAKKEYDHNGKMVVMWISLMALVVAIIYFKDSILLYWKKFKMQQIELKQTEKDALSDQSSEQNSGFSSKAAMIVNRQSQSHELRNGERAHE